MFKYLLVAFLFLSGPVVAAPPDFVTYPVQGRWEAGTDFYADILNHLKGQPERLESRYLCSHENTHTLDSDIAMGVFRATGQGGVTAFYVGQDRAVLVPRPKFTVLDVAPYVPEALRGNRYRLYLQEQPTKQPGLNKDPLYPLVEWNGYVSGAVVAAEDAEAKRPIYGTDGVFATVEFMTYSMCVGMAAQKYDPDCLKPDAQFHRFLVWQAERSMAVYRRGVRFKEFQWNREYVEELRAGPGGKPVRDFMTGVLKMDLDRLFGGR